MQFTLIDPATGKTQAAGSYHLKGQFIGCVGYTGGEGLRSRETFSPDFTKYAAVQTNSADGSTRAGYYDLDSGQWTAAPVDPSAPSGFGQVVSQSDAVFSPTTGYLWFRSGSDIVSVQPGSDAIHDRQALPWLTTEASNARHCAPVAVTGYVPPGCATPHFLLTPGTDAPVVSTELFPNPSGTFGIGPTFRLDGTSLEKPVLYTPDQMRASGFASGQGPGQSGAAVACGPVAWLSDTKFICAGAKAVQIADISNPAIGSIVPLLPTNTVYNWSFVANPKNQNVAFLSSPVQGAVNNATTSLFVTNAATPGVQPTKVVELDFLRKDHPDTTVISIFGWTE